MYKIVETIFRSEKQQFKSIFKIHFKTFWGWKILTRKEINEKELIFDSYKAAEDYLKDQTDYSGRLIKDGNTYKFDEYYIGMVF
jgi:hypothetical protein